MMDTSLNATPSRRGCDGGASPRAKKPPACPGFSEPAPSVMNHNDLVHAFLRLQTRYEADVPWHAAMADALTDHAEQIEMCKGFFRTMGTEVQSQSRDIDGIKKVVQDNDSDLKARIATNDELIKHLLETVDHKIAEAVVGLQTVHESSMAEINGLRNHVDNAQAVSLLGRMEKFEAIGASVSDAMTCMQREIDVGHTKCGE